MAKKTREIVMRVKPSEDGRVTLVKVRGGSGKKRKQGTPGTRVFERVVRQLARAAEASSQSYLSRHEQSNRRRRDGWLYDLGANVVESANAGSRKIRVWKLLDV